MGGYADYEAQADAGFEAHGGAYEAEAKARFDAGQLEFIREHMKAGGYVMTLWHVTDVMQLRPDLGREEAMTVLEGFEGDEGALSKAFKDAMISRRAALEFPQEPEAEPPQEPEPEPGPAPTHEARERQPLRDCDIDLSECY